MLKRYKVRGEYGWQEGDYIQKVYRAHSAENARKRFIREVRPIVSKDSWESISGNMYVNEVRNGIVCN